MHPTIMDWLADNGVAVCIGIVVLAGLISVMLGADNDLE